MSINTRTASPLGLTPSGRPTSASRPCSPGRSPACATWPACGLCSAIPSAPRCLAIPGTRLTRRLPPHRSPARRQSEAALAMRLLYILVDDLEPTADELARLSAAGQAAVGPDAT